MGALRLNRLILFSNIVMAKKKRQRREYLRFLDKSKESAECAIDNFNRAKGPFRTEATLMLLGVAWELLAKAVLIQMKKSIKKANSEDTISAEVAVSRLLFEKKIEKHHSDIVQQIISLRNASVHDVLPDIPVEVQHHLMYYACKFYREVVFKYFKGHASGLGQHYLSLSFDELTTYADKVHKTVSRVRKSDSAKKLVWLLERGVAFDGGSYLTQKQFDAKIKGKSRTLPYLELGKHMKESDMVRIIPVEAPKNYTADLILRKGNPNDSSLPVIVKRTDLEKDYPYLTNELAKIIGRSTQFVAKATTVLGLRGNDKFHQAIRASKSGGIQRYSEAARSKLQQKLAEDPAFNPY